MQRAVIARARQALARNAKYTPAFSHSSLVARVAAQHLQATRSFQSTGVTLLRRRSHGARTTAPKASANESDNDSDSDNEDGADSSDSDLDSDDEELEEAEDEDEEAEGEGDAEVDPEAAAMAAQYIGVKYSPDKVKKYSAELELDELVISGGDFWTALDAAKGYDELVDMYCDLDTPRNFPAGSQDAEAAAGAVSSSTAAASSAQAAEWAIPETGKRNADVIPPIPGKYLELDEVLEALAREKAIDVYTVNLSGKSSLADYMIFTTGRSQAHMRRMADMMIASMKARELKDEFEYSVEGRDCDDWMIADCSNIVVHFMREDTRRILNLEDHWENMVNDKHKVYGDMNEEEYMDRFGTSELMEYIEDDDFIPGESAEAESIAKGDDVDWK